MSPRAPTVAKLCQLGVLELVVDAAKRHGATLDDVLGRDRRPRLVAARHACWFVLYDHATLRFSFPDIGELWGVDHTTVMSAVHRYGAACGLVMAKPGLRRVA